MQYENNPANAFRDIVRKRNTAGRQYMVMTISPAPTSWASDKNCQITPKWTVHIKIHAKKQIGIRRSRGGGGGRV